MTADKELRTPRLSLRQPVAGDVDAILGVHADPRACEHNPSDALTTRAEAADLLAGWQRNWHLHGVGYWVIRRRDDPAVQGFCGVKLMSLAGDPVLNLFYRLDPAAWGNGVAAEAATEVVRWATSERPDLTLVARVRPDNVASARVAIHSGLLRARQLDTTGQDGVDHIYIYRSLPWRPCATRP